jgi:hypothetical protein
MWDNVLIWRIVEIRLHSCRRLEGRRIEGRLALIRRELLESIERHAGRYEIEPLDRQTARESAVV